MSKFVIWFYPFLLILFSYMGYALWQTGGFIKKTPLIIFTFGLLIFHLGHFGISKKKYDKEIISKIIFFVLFIFGFLLIVKPYLIYSNNQFSDWVLRIPILLLLGIVVWSSRIKAEFLDVISQRMWVTSLMVMIFSLLLVLFFSPNPIVDVFTVIQLGAKNVVHGINPYTFEYPDLYQGRYGYVAGQVYFPMILLTAIPFVEIFGDLRLYYIVCYALIAYFLWKESPKFLFCWLLFPVHFYILENAWTETPLVLFSFISLVYLHRKQWILASLFAGLFLATKQYSVFFGMLYMAFLFRHLNWKNFILCGLVFVAPLIVTLVPFLLWDSSSFVARTITDLLSYDARLDSLSWTAYFLREYLSSFWVFWGMKITLIETMFWASFFLMSKKNPDLSDLIGSWFSVYMITFLFGKQAFCNYYYLVAMFLLFYLIFSIESLIPKSSET